MRVNPNLTTAEQTYAVSNVPLFLLRRLQADAAPRTVAASWTADEILDALQRALREKPQTLSDTVWPYVLLVALEQKRDLAKLKSAASLAAPYHDWFSYLAAVLVQTFTPSMLTPFKIPGQIHGSIPSSTSASSATTNNQILRP
jgi:hypothetical protein